MEIPDGNFGHILLYYFRKGKNSMKARKKLYNISGEIVYYVPRRIMRVITRWATMLAGDRSRDDAEARSVHIFYFMWLQRIYEFLCVHSNPIWKGRNCRDYCPSHLTFRENFRPFWFSRSCVVAAYCNRRMQVQGFVSTLRYSQL